MIKFDERDVDLRDLKVDSGYQQAVSRQRCEKLAKDFNLKFVDRILVNERDGSIFIVDGKVRVNAALLAGHNSLPARVVQVDRPTEIRLFSGAWFID